MKAFKEKIRDLFDDYEKLVTRKNIPVEGGNGIFTRYQYPVLTAAHTPVFWRYDLDEKTNPFLMERIGMNATLNSGAIKWNGKYLLVVRVEGWRYCGSAPGHTASFQSGRTGRPGRGRPGHLTAGRMLWPWLQRRPGRSPAPAAAFCGRPGYTCSAP